MTPANTGVNHTRNYGKSSILTVIEYFGLETLEIIYFQPLAGGRDTTHWITWLSTLPMDGAPTSLGCLCQHLTILRQKNFFLISDNNPPLF